MSKVIILFGEMGAGKTYAGKLAAEYGHDFFDGDDVVPPAMRECVKAFKPIPITVLDDFVYEHLAPAILERCKDNDLFVAQALYRIEHRRYLKQVLTMNGIRVKFFEVKVPFMQNLKQLWRRDQGWRWVCYWLMNKPFYQVGEV
jgi:dephospho-CoA kinase